MPEPPAVPDPTTGPSPGDAAAPAAPGERVGPYRLLQLLGEGGMGAVYEAEQLVPVRRRVALKLIKVGMDTREVVARFEAERQALALMDHPGIARVFDGGATETGRPYFVMELVRGVPITAFCDQHRLAIPDRIDLFARVCDAVQHAHQKGIIHRDLKPSNVLVTLQDDAPAPRIIDFGIAKATGHGLTDRTLVTRYGDLVGSIEYMSPEQAGLSEQGVDTLSDVYSLGVMLYELLAGVLPFDASALRGLHAIVTVRESEAPRPSKRFGGLADARATVAAWRRTEADALHRRLRGDLDSIVMKAMARDPRERYETAHALAQDLRRHLRHEPVTARPPSAGYRVRKFIRRHRAGVAFTAILAALVIAGAVTLAEQTRRIAAQRDRAELEVAKTRAVYGFLEETLLSPDPIDRLGRGATVIEALERAASRLPEQPADPIEVDATVRSAIGWAFFRLGRLDEAEPLLRTALETRLAIHGEAHTDVAESLRQTGMLLESRAAFDSAGVLLQRSLAVRERLSGGADPALGAALLAYGAWLLGRGRYDEAEDYLLRAASNAASGGADRLQVAEAQNRLGQLWWTRGEYARAEAAFREALRFRQSLLPPGHALVAESLNNLAVLLDDLGEYGEAEALYRQAVATMEQVWGVDGEPVAATLGNLALVLGRRGEIEEAEALFRRQIAIDRAHFGPSHPTVAVDLVNLGSLLCDHGRATEGADLLRTSAQTLERSFPGQWESAGAWGTYGHCVARLGRHDEGERRLREAIAVIEAALGSDHPRTERFRNRLAEVRSWRL